MKELRVVTDMRRASAGVCYSASIVYEVELVVYFVFTGWDLVFTPQQLT